MNAQNGIPATERGALLFFNDLEARTVEAVVERIVPGDAAGAGATDADVTTDIDASISVTA